MANQCHVSIGIEQNNVHNFIIKFDTAIKV